MNERMEEKEDGSDVRMGIDEEERGWEGRIVKEEEERREDRRR